MSVVTVFVIVTITFILFRLLPGDPTLAVLSPLLPAEMHQKMREIFGLDEPLAKQYVLYIGNVLRGELGRSFLKKKPVTEVLSGRLANTLILGGVAFIMTYIAAVILSLVMVARRGTWIDSLLVSFCLLLRAPPLFWTGMMAIMLFSFKLQWFPYAGVRTPGYPTTGFWGMYFNMDFLRHLILPATVMSGYFLSFPTLLLRNAMLRHLPSDYVRTARAKGLGEVRILLKHVFRNALLPVVTSAATHIGLSFGGLAVLEYVFNWPGLGRVIIEGIQQRDYPVVQGAFLFIGAMVVIMNIIADLTYANLDPRISYE